MLQRLSLRKLALKVRFVPMVVPKVDENAIKKRYELRKHIQNGSIDEAILTIKEIKSDF